LRVPCQAFLQARHANEDHPKAAVVKDIAHLFERGHFQAVGLVDNDQGGGIRERHALLMVRYTQLAIREPRPFLDWFGKPIFFREDVLLVGGFLLLQLLTLRVLLPSEGFTTNGVQPLAQALDIVRNVPWRVHHLRSVE
jgi:hypothetical protein